MKPKEIKVKNNMPDCPTCKTNNKVSPVIYSASSQPTGEYVCAGYIKIFRPS